MDYRIVALHLERLPFLNIGANPAKAPRLPLRQLLCLRERRLPRATGSRFRVDLLGERQSSAPLPEPLHKIRRARLARELARSTDHPANLQWLGAFAKDHSYAIAETIGAICRICSAPKLGKIVPQRHELPKHGVLTAIDRVRSVQKPYQPIGRPIEDFF